MKKFGFVDQINLCFLLERARILKSHVYISLLLVASLLTFFKSQERFFKVVKKKKLILDFLVHLSLNYIILLLNSYFIELQPEFNTFLKRI